MYRLSLSVIFVGVGYFLFAQKQSPHGASGPKECAACHVAGDWWTMKEDMNFNHNSQTRFVLNGAHNELSCTACHQSLVFAEAPDDCMACHTDIHSGTVGNDCSRCHDEESWLVDFIPELHEMNGFMLTGAHSGINCAECHASEVNLRFDRIGNECMNCHTTDYYATRDPNHVEVGFGTNCVDCHDALQNDWDAVVQIEHDFFPLAGGHEIGNCNVCHTSTNYQNISAECLSCHQSDYASTTNPDHEQLGFPTDCASCHTIFDWSSENYDHSQWPLTGAHTKVSCNNCHQGDFRNTSSDCLACHNDDYTATSNPDHSQANFSNDCTECHTDESWVPSLFDHNSFFPIERGNHRRGDAWDLCIECHTEPTNFMVFSCIECHEHNKNEMDDEHDDVRNYVYESSACYNCHPRGDD